VKPRQFIALWFLIQIYGTDQPHDWTDYPGAAFAVLVLAYESWLFVRPCWVRDRTKAKQ
jgi:hypothetical protein